MFQTGVMADDDQMVVGGWQEGSGRGGSMKNYSKNEKISSPCFFS